MTVSTKPVKLTLDSPESRERIAELVVRGGGRLYSREKIKGRVMALLHRIAKQLDAESSGGQLAAKEKSRHATGNKPARKELKRWPDCTPQP